MANYQVVFSKKYGHWRVLKDNAQRASATANTQKKAEMIAKKMAFNSGGGEVRIHSPRGFILDSDTVRKKDPFPPRDKKH